MDEGVMNDKLYRVGNINCEYEILNTGVNDTAAAYWQPGSCL
jgi:hypothetical protein